MHKKATEEEIKILDGFRDRLEEFRELNEIGDVYYLSICVASIMGVCRANDVAKERLIDFISVMWDENYK